MPLRVAVQMDPLQHINIEGDSTFAIMLIGTVLLIFDLVIGRTAAFVMAGITLLLVIIIGVLPVILRGSRPDRLACSEIGERMINRESFEQSPHPELEVLPIRGSVVDTKTQQKGEVPGDVLVLLEECVDERRQLFAGFAGRVVVEDTRDLSDDLPGGVIRRLLVVGKAATPQHASPFFRERLADLLR